ncbi:uncharacterized protein LOC106150841 [Lingula anatina]|uniref:Uncharacterized protein LOC106150841 n=1 Tax=Lingula anatina TaxID=7574 RepID=A0A1S3H2C9_LINAN|nr:uncharacterized protein LOC106150841 [Lingula anatina]XP_013379299.1 uncharacterized protein LOC106150841 [Lingula anatina]|eukprot:XP_013379298.1 uncharacterized protein LOC106150841 [Lingula anatina]
MGIDMSRPLSSNQEICQEGHLLIHMKMDVITRDDGQQNLTLRCSLCDSVLRMSEVSRSPLLNCPVVTAAGQSIQKTNQADTNTSERESSFADFSQDFVKTDPDSVCDDCEDDLDLDMHVESYESFQLSNENCNNIDHCANEEDVLNSKTIDKTISPLCTDAIPNSTEKSNEKEITSTVDRGTRRRDSQPRNMESFLKRKIQKSPISVEQIPKKTPKLQANRGTISVSLESSNQLSDNKSNKNSSSSGQLAVSAQISSSERRFKIPSCKFCFATHSDFGENLLCIHKCPKTGTTIFICSVCNEYYSSCTLLVECERKHRQVNATFIKEEFKCMVCDKTFVTFREAKRHETCHIQTDTGVAAGASLLHEANSISGPGRPEPDYQNSHISNTITSSTPLIHHSQVPLMHQNSHISHAVTSSTIHHSQVPQAFQFSRLCITQNELEELKSKAHDSKSFCIKLMCKIFSSDERLQNDRNVLGISTGGLKKKSLCPIRIQFIKDCVWNMYPTDFQNNPSKMWRACVAAMNSCNRGFRCIRRKQSRIQK